MTHDSDSTPPQRPVNYGEYLRLPEILAAQSPGRPLLHHDEMLFIIVHQVYELWFKLILHELTAARDLLVGLPAPGGRRRVPESDIPRIVAHLTRVIETQRILLDQFRVIETMPPLHFLAFRDRLAPASGFQSVQFRELEALAGLAEAERADSPAGSLAEPFSEAERRRVAARRRETSLATALVDWLSRTPVELAFPGFREAFFAAFRTWVTEQAALHRQSAHLNPAQVAAIEARLHGQVDACRRFLEGEDEPTGRAHAAFVFITTYRTEPLLVWPHALIERIVEFEENLRKWRFAHARMVERMIGVRTGTGGSPGVDYLDHTAFRYRLFGNLLIGRSFLVPRERLPDLPSADVFRFRFEEENAGD